MHISKEKLLKLINEMPEPVAIEEVIYRLYFLNKAETEQNSREAGRPLTHEEALLSNFTASQFSRSRRTM